MDRLGGRLRKENITEGDKRLLDDYRHSFTESYERVLQEIRSGLALKTTGRVKTTTSIIEKLRRQSIRLSQIQDIAGCRVVVPGPGLLTEDEAVETLKLLFNRTIIDDRREQPSHGYRAVHVIVEDSGKLIEVQVRTSLQHLWGELSEKLSDVVDSAIKYGGGDREVLAILNGLSEKIRDHELAESAHFAVESGDEAEDELKELFEGLKISDLVYGRLSIINTLQAIGEAVPRLKGKKR